MILHPTQKDRIINLLNQFSSYALALGAKPKELRCWLDMEIAVHVHVGSTEEPNHEEHLRYLIEELCRFAPEVGIPLEVVLVLVQDRVEFRDGIRGIMQGANPPLFEDVSPEAGQSDSSMD